MKIQNKLFIFPLFLTSTLCAANNTTMYNGNTGVIETPNARIMPDWSMRFFYNEDQPYTYYGITATPLPFMETNFHMTQIDGIDALSGSYGDYKDKFLGMKFLLKKEGMYNPSLVLGFDDFWGTGLYTSKYMVASKKIKYFDFSLGYAIGRLGGNQIDSTASSNSGSTDNRAFNFITELDWSGGSYFGSVVFSPIKQLDLMLEYSPIDYNKDSVNPFGARSTANYDLPKSEYNFGLKYNYSDNSTFSLSYTRGNNVAFGYAYQFGFDRTGMFDHLPDPKWKATDDIRNQYKKLDEEKLAKKLANEIAAEKMKNVSVQVNDNKIWAEFDNPRYKSDLKAVGRSISTINQVLPKKYDTLYALLKEGDFPIKAFKVNRTEYDAYENERVSSDYFKKSLEITDDVDTMYEEFNPENKKLTKTEKIFKGPFKYDLNLKVDSVLNSPDNPLALKFSGRANLGYNFGNGLSSSATITHPFYNEIKNLNDQTLETDPKLAVGTSTLPYKQYDSTQLRNLALVKLFRTPFNSFAKAEVGYLELAYAGTDLEWYKSFLNERFGIGLQYQRVYKRAVSNMLKVDTDLAYDGKFINLYTLLSEDYNLHAGIKYGQFLAGDKGFRFDISRQHKGFTLGAFATFTNSNEVFTNEQNKGYIDKGVYIRFPLEVFTYENLKTTLGLGLSPWTRDVGRYSASTKSLYYLNNNETNKNILYKNIENIIE